MTRQLVFLPLSPDGKGGGGKLALGWSGPNYEGVPFGDGVNRGLVLHDLLVVDCDSPEATAWFRSTYGPSSVFQKTAKPGHEQHFFEYTDIEKPTLISLRPEVDIDIKFSRKQQVKVHDKALVAKLQRQKLLVPPPELVRKFRLHKPASSQRENTDSRLIHGEGDRHWPMVRLAGWLREQGYDTEAIFEMVMAQNVATFVPVLDEQWVRQVAESAGSWEQGTPREAPEGPLQLVPLTGEPKRARWLWAGRIALGELTLVGGREGVGKSTAVLDLAASLSLGRLPGEFEGAPRGTIVVASEDSYDHTIIPRLIAAGADRSRVSTIRGHAHGSGLVLPTDLDALATLVQEHDIGMVLLDPLLPRLDSKLDTHKDAEVRQGLEPLVAFAHDTKCAVVGLIHVNKTATTDMLTSLMASRAFTAVARSVLFAMYDPDPTAPQGQRVLSNAKNNLAEQAPTLTYVIEGKCVGEDDGEIWTGKVAWTKTDDPRSSHDLMQQAAAPAHRPPDAKMAAIDWLEERLRTDGPTLKQPLVLQGMAQGHSERTLQRARKELGVETTMQDGKAVWSMPE